MKVPVAAPAEPVDDGSGGQGGHRGASTLADVSVVVTRMSEQGGRMRRELRDLGAIDVSVPLISLDAPADGGAALGAAVGAIDDYEWVVCTSPNGADKFIDCLEVVAGPHRRAADGFRLAAIGPGTADRLTQRGMSVDFVPARSVGEALVEEFPEPDTERRRLLVPQAEVARPVVRDGLSAKGWQVDVVAAYRTVDAVVTDAQRQAIAGAEVITFTSASTVDRFCALVGIEHIPPVVASIGPITSARAREVGLAVDIEADPHTIDGLIDALVEHLNS